MRTARGTSAPKKELTRDAITKHHACCRSFLLETSADASEWGDFEATFSRDCHAHLQALSPAPARQRRSEAPDPNPRFSGENSLISEHQLTALGHNLSMSSASHKTGSSSAFLQVYLGLTYLPMTKHLQTPTHLSTVTNLLNFLMKFHDHFIKCYSLC